MRLFPLEYLKLEHKIYLPTDLSYIPEQNNIR